MHHTIGSCVRHTTGPVGTSIGKRPSYNQSRIVMEWPKGEVTTAGAFLPHINTRYMHILYSRSFHAKFKAAKRRCRSDLSESPGRWRDDPAQHFAHNFEQLSEHYQKFYFKTVDSIMFIRIVSAYSILWTEGTKGTPFGDTKVSTSLCLCLVHLYVCAVQQRLRHACGHEVREAYCRRRQ